MNQNFKIFMRTQMGVLNGFLNLKQVNNELMGNINFNGKSYEFRNGKINGNNFEFSGILKVFLKKINYNAIGEINNKNITININTNMGSFKIEGEKI